MPVPRSRWLSAFTTLIVFFLVPLQDLLGDFVLYSLPGTNLVIMLEGKTKIGGFGIIEFTHPVHGTIVLNQDSAAVVKAPSKQDDFKRLFSKANSSKNIEAYLTAAKVALQRGMLKEFYECCSLAYKIDPTHPTLQRLGEVRTRMKTKLSDQSEAESKARQLVNRPNMVAEFSDHYVLLHDTKEDTSNKKKKSRAASRLALLETVYESYFLKFAFDGITLDPPTERLVVILFKEENDFKRYSTQIDPTLLSAAGFWSTNDNACVFYDQGNSDRMKILDDFNADLKRLKAAAKGTAVSRETAHLSGTIDLLVKVAKEEDDIEVVSHEATHQLAGNTGLMPRKKVALRWAHEGLAAYFETSSDSVWSGIGAVNERRLKSYYRVSSDPKRRSIDLLINDSLFDNSKSIKEESDAYGQAWALTHYLMENKPEQLAEYYRRASEIEVSDEPIERKVLVDLFAEVFGDLKKLELDWHLYMESLKTDFDRLREALR
jgi:hypothetical protein